MNTIIDLYNKILVYNKNNISFIIDNTNIIWFRLADITNILKYKSRKDVIKDMIDKKYRKHLRDIVTTQEIDRTQSDTIYITESGLYKLVIRSKMKIAEKFQEWIVEDALPKLRKYGKYELDNKIKHKIDILNNKIKILKKNNTILKNNMTKDKYPNGYHIYIIKDNGLYKIGYTKNLKKRLSTYNTGKANKCYYIYYKKTECAKEIEICMKAFLNRYIYKSNKEFYNCSEKIIINVINKCLKIENNCNKCHEINNNNI